MLGIPHLSLLILLNLTGLKWVKTNIRPQGALKMIKTLSNAICLPIGLPICLPIGLMQTCLVILFMPLTSFAGGMTSSGGDSHKWGNESAWFLGNQPTSYCIEIAPTEKLSLSQVKSDFESVVSIWQKYYLQRANTLHSVDHKLNFNFAFENCQPSTRLKIYIGVDNLEIQKAKKLYQKPYALAFRKDYDFTLGLGLGFLWFAPRPANQESFPNWSLPNVFHGMLLHEMGHVFGCGHMPHTIMAEDLMSELQIAASDDANWAKFGKVFMTQIDHHYFLLFNDNVRTSMKGRIHLNKEVSKIRFQRLTGRVPIGSIQAEAELFGDRVELSLSDDIRKDVFKLPLNYSNRTSFSLGGQVFLSVRGSTGESTGTSGQVFLTTITTIPSPSKTKSEKLMAQVEINADELGWPIRIRYMDNGVLEDVFGSDLWINAGLP